jgi:hypothetical protein
MKIGIISKSYCVMEVHKKTLNGLLEQNKSKEQISSPLRVSFHRINISSTILLMQYFRLMSTHFRYHISIQVCTQIRLNLI